MFECIVYCIMTSICANNCMAENIHFSEILIIEVGVRDNCASIKDFSQ